MSVFLMTLGLEAYTLWSSNPLRLDSHLKVNCGLNFNLSKTLFPYGLSKRPARCKMTVIYSCMFPSAIGKQGRFWNWNWGVRPLRPGWNYIVATQLKCYFHFMSMLAVAATGHVAMWFVDSFPVWCTAVFQNMQNYIWGCKRVHSSLQRTRGALQFLVYILLISP